MDLIKIRSKKHPGSIFLKVKGTKEDFICKVYAGEKSEIIANFIKKSFEREFSPDGNPFEEDLQLLSDGIKDIYSGIDYLHQSGQKLYGVDFERGHLKVQEALKNLGM